MGPLCVGRYFSIGLSFFALFLCLGRDTKTKPSRQSFIKRQTKTMKKKPGVTLLSGFLGAGKTTLLKRIAENDLGYKIAVVVNDVAALNIDASFVRKSGRKKAFDHNAIIEMQNGCVCCTLRTDLVKAIAELATMGKYDAIVVEASGVSEPAQIGEMFQVEFDAGGFPAAEESLKNARDQNAMAQVLRAMKGAISLEEIVRLDTYITVVDCAAFNGDITTPEDLVSRFGLRDTENGERSVAALLAEQIEFADLIVLNKCDLVKRHEANVIEDAVRNLNPGAQILRTEFSNVPLNLVLNTHRFDMKKVSNNAGWLRGLRKNRVVETREYGISSFVYRSTTPFHPIRLASFLESFCGVVNLDGIDEKRVAYNENGFHDARAKFGYVLRSKGFIWLAGRDDMCGEWGHAGSNLSIGCGGPWMGALPENAWPEEGTEAREMLERDMSNAIILDRRQELVFIGQRLNKCAIEAALEKCLVTRKESLNSMNKRMDEWKLGLSGILDPADNPFPAWPTLDNVDFGGDVYMDHHNHNHHLHHH